nr:hypothetical protein CFP56_58782 [Quercus suber]
MVRGMSRGPCARLTVIAALAMVIFFVFFSNSPPLQDRLQDVQANWVSTDPLYADMNPNNVSGLIKHTDSSHLVLKSRRTSDGKYWNVRFGHGHPSANVNFVPHFAKPNVWWIVAQHFKFPGDYQMFFTQLVCEASFNEDGVLHCNKAPVILPIQGTDTDQCTGELGFWNINIGPHDARAFQGPDAPYIMYGTQSKWHCMGQFIQDFRRITDWSEFPKTDKSLPFFWPTDIQRPRPHGPVEKNYFVFWDQNKEMYIHADLPPKRSFAKLHPDGTANKNLAPMVAAKDAKCVKDKMAKVLSEYAESNHQATNSLAITMCKRSDPTCVPSSQNTFIFAIFQSKTFYQAHGVYEPYLMVFQNIAPFSMHAFSKRPLWIHGRGEAGGEWGKGNKETYAPASSLNAPEDQTEMVYVTSMAWKEKNVTYQGFLDDELWLGFGVEDRKSGGMDVIAQTLMDDLDFC